MVTLVEVGPRDGLQNEPKHISTQTKIEFINRLSKTGLQYIEAASFVSPKWVPQMAGSLEVMQNITREKDITYAGLTPNLQGLESALSAKVDEVAIFTAASNSFTLKNINCTIKESLQKASIVIEQAKQNGLTVRGYVSCIAGCPYEGDVAIKEVVHVSEQLFSLGCREISLGDTIGVGTAKQISNLVSTVKQSVPLNQLAIHCHDTYGQALANIYAAIEAGVEVIDASIAGLGGCPYAKGASGNVASEDVLYMLEGMGIATGVCLEQMMQTSAWICHEIGRTNHSKVTSAKLSSGPAANNR